MNAFLRQSPVTSLVSVRRALWQQLRYLSPHKRHWYLSTKESTLWAIVSIKVPCQWYLASSCSLAAPQTRRHGYVGKFLWCHFGYSEIGKFHSTAHSLRITGKFSLFRPSHFQICPYFLQCSFLSLCSFLFSFLFVFIFHFVPFLFSILFHFCFPFCSFLFSFLLFLSPLFAL